MRSEHVGLAEALTQAEHLAAAGDRSAECCLLERADSRVKVQILGSITLLVVKSDEQAGRYRDQSNAMKQYNKLHAIPEVSCRRAKRSRRACMQSLSPLVAANPPLSVALQGCSSTASCVQRVSQAEVRQHQASFAQSRHHLSIAADKQTWCRRCARACSSTCACTSRMSQPATRRYCKTCRRHSGDACCASCTSSSSRPPPCSGVQHCCREVYEASTLCDSLQLLQDLPTPLRRRVLRFMCLQQLTSTPLFRCAALLQRSV